MPDDDRDGVNTQDKLDQFYDNFEKQFSYIGFMQLHESHRELIKQQLALENHRKTNIDRLKRYRIEVMKLKGEYKGFK